MLRIAAYIFHPLLLPLLGVILYYLVTPRFNDPELIRAHCIAIGILTLLIPLVFFFLLRSLGVLKTIEISETKERKLPLMIQCVLMLVILKFIFNAYESVELYYFFLGILCSTMSALVLVFFNFKASLHQMGISGLTIFLLLLSIHFKINLLVWIAFFLIANGWVASSRLETKSHTVQELITGFFIGIMPQFFFVPYWL